jgi:hypothetical protein
MYSLSRKDYRQLNWRYASHFNLSAAIRKYPATGDNPGKRDNLPLMYLPHLHHAGHTKKFPCSLCAARVYKFLCSYFIDKLGSNP